jgi:uncharacterized repeat protein (TIGR04138 family)
MADDTREPVDFTEMMKQVRQKDPRFAPEAYAFVFQALDYTMTVMKGKRQHVTGQELLEGVRKLALREFGRLAPMVFRQWGVTRSRDFGDMVYNMIGTGAMGKRDEDRIEDFDDGWDMDTAFDVDDPAEDAGKE